MVTTCYNLVETEPPLTGAFYTHEEELHPHIRWVQLEVGGNKPGKGPETPVINRISRVNPC